MLLVVIECGCVPLLILVSKQRNSKMAFTMETLSLLLEQNQCTIKGFIDIIMKEHRIQIDGLKSEIGVLKASLESSQAEIVDLKKQVAANVKVNSSTNEVSDTVNEISKRHTMAETDARRCNIRIDGLAEDSTENSEQTQSKVVKFIKDKLSVNISPQ